MTYDKIILGAGLYGLYAAEKCGAASQRVLVLGDQGLAAALQAVQNDPDAARARAEKARANLDAHFTWQAVFATMKEIARTARAGR